MPRYKQEGQLDDEQGDLGDKAFVGVNMRLEPHNVPPGYVSRAINTRFRNGAAETRRGVVGVSWANNLSGTSWVPWGTVQGSTTFKDPTTNIEYLIIAAGGAVYYTYENATPVQLSLEAGLTITGKVEFIQAFNVLIMLRGGDEDPIVMKTIAGGFVSITEAEDSTGLFTIPRAERGVGMANRVFLISLTDNTQTDDDGVAHQLNSSDNVAYSDALDYTHYSINQEFRINQGENDRLIALAEFGKSTLLCFKDSSVYRVDNVYGNLDAVSLSRVTGRYGCVAPDSIIDTGTDVLWLSREGIASLTLTAFSEIIPTQGAITQKPRMFSEDIQPLIERINWEYAQNSIGQLVDNKAYFAVPLDDAEVVGHELANGLEYIPNPFNYVTLTGIVAGGTYRWVKTATETSLVNGTETLTGSGDFTAQGTTVVINNASNATNFGGSVKRVYKGVNNAILVYDFLNGAWSGHDEVPGSSVLKMFKYTYRKEERLFVINQDGWVQLYEEDFEDQLTVPYTDIEVTTEPANLDTIQVNGGDTITASTVLSQNTGTTWGVSGALAADITNLFGTTIANSGYNPGLATVWTCPNATPINIATGVRFYSTNGVVPSYVVAGTWSTISQVTTQPIITTIEFRAYDSPTASGVYYQWLTLDIQTWAPQYAISLFTEGVEEEDTKVSAKTKDRTKWDRPFNKADFEVDNDNGDFMDAYRQDYSLDLGARAATDFAVHTITDGVRLDMHQEFRELFRINKRARSAQPKIVNSVGRIRVLASNVTTNLKNRQASERGA